jgi:hypothetical protein
MLPLDKSLQGTASRASTALSTTWTSRYRAISITVHLKRGETTDDLPIRIPVSSCRVKIDRLCTHLSMPARFETGIP